jgi:hypothetical protein
LLGVKHLDFYDWKIAYNLIKNKEHLTKEGELKIR